jgi:2-polyprenyl-3-methyl-5-hydroxy-6-metoxy-1,4-benzoquinol methylase
MSDATNFYYRFGKYPANQSLVQGITHAASKLDKKLELLELDKLVISEYNHRYFGGYIHTSGSRLLNLTKYAYVLAWALAYLDKPMQDAVFLDHGAGHGMMSLLAEEYGIGTVIHSDIYPVSCADAKIIAEALENPADYYLPGNIDDVLEFCKKNELSCDSVANYDVIEHIYNIDAFLQKVGQLSDGQMSIFFASAANERNPRINKQLMTMHQAFESNDREVKKGRKPTDATRAIAELRKEIIAKYAPELPDVKVADLARLTRGLVEEDIKKQVDLYILKGLMPPSPPHPTNTCDPFTGNWFERLMDPDDLVKILQNAGFQTSLKCGYYDQPRNLLKRMAKLFLNMLIRLSGSGRRGLVFAPYFALSARK